MRCFISINVPKEVQEEIRKIQERLPDFRGKKTELENLHLTLKFLGEISENRAEKVKNKLKDIKFEKFEAGINEIGVFSEKFIRIIWLHLAGCDELQKIVDDKLKSLFKPEKRFMSHLTIARVKNIKDKKRFLKKLKNIKIPKIKFQVNNFYLMKSQLTKDGSKYEVIKEYSLV